MDSNQIDTILFRNDQLEKVDTIICNISEARSYRFVFNECCGGFNVLRKEHSSGLTARVHFTTTDTISKFKLIGTIGESGIV